MTKLLSKLDLTTKPEKPTDKLSQRRNKLLDRLAAQKNGTVLTRKRSV